MTERKRPGPVASSDAVKHAWEYPLFDALADRRSRRFGLGMQIKDGPNKYRSEAEPVPLSEIETALIAWAACGLTGYSYADLPFHERGISTGANNTIRFVGRTFPSACASHGTELFFTNDDGIFLFKLRDAMPEALREFTSVEDRDKVLELFRKHVIKLADKRLEIPRTVPGVPGVVASSEGAIETMNQWDVNKPGTTVWMPVTDMAWEYVNLLLIGMPIVDDLNGNVPAGVGSWFERGRLNVRHAIPLSSRERFCFQLEVHEAACIQQNIQLAHTAMGLGGWTFANPDALVVMGGTQLTKGLGFRFAASKRGVAPGSEGAPNPVGIDGIFEAHSPPYYRDMSDVVDAVAAAKWGENGIYTDRGGPHPYKDRAAFNAQVPRASAEQIQIAKDIATYIYETYGRLPATLDTMWMHLWTQTHHLDCGYYDTYYPEGTYTDAHRNHMKLWHPK